GMLIAEHPRTDPGVRDSRTGLPPWVVDGEAFARPRMKDTGLTQELPGKLSYPFPCRSVLLTAALERSSPKIHNIVPDGAQGFAVRVGAAFFAAHDFGPCVVQQLEFRLAADEFRRGILARFIRFTITKCILSR